MTVSVFFTLGIINILCFRKWIFKEINVPKNKLLHYQETVIGDLVYPRQTILDESLGSALWFAAQGTDELMGSPCRVSYFIHKMNDFLDIIFLLLIIIGIFLDFTIRVWC